MSLSTSKISSCAMGSNGANITESCRIITSFSKPIYQIGSHAVVQKFDLRRPGYGRLFTEKLSFSCDGPSNIYGKPVVTRENSFLCQSRGTHNTEAKECVRHTDDYSDVSRSRTQIEHNEVGSFSEHNSTNSSQGLADIRTFVYNDVKYVNERARNDIVLLSRGIMKLNDRACQDVAVLGLGFLKLDARAREDTEKIDHGVKKKAERLHHIATILQDKAQSKLKRAADKHWNDGALEADLRRADSLAKRRAMEDAFMALKFVKDIHDMMVSKMYNLPLGRNEGSLSATDMMNIMLEKNGKTVDFLSVGLTPNRITSVQEAYWSMASALSEADGIDYTDPEELELVVATLMDLDAMDGKSSVSLLAECSSSPDVSTRKALTNALTAAPSMWALGNAGMGALQRLSKDSNPAIARAASRAIYELKKQWKIGEGDSWRFTMNQKQAEEMDDTENNNGDAETD